MEQILLVKPFNESFFRDVQLLFHLSSKYSPLSDIRSILKREQLHLGCMIFSAESGERYLLRNVIRLILKLSHQPYANKIRAITLKKSRIGCDYFLGQITVNTDENSFVLDYVWQWSAFSKPIGYDRFVKFETIQIPQ